MDALAACITVPEEDLWLWRMINATRTCFEDVPQAVQQLIFVVQVIREYLSTGYGLRFSMDVHLREQTGENGFPRKPTGNLFCSYRNLRKSPETSGSLRENVI